MYYILRLNEGDARVDRIQSSSLEQAKIFFMQRKQMDKTTFESLYHIEEDSNE